jgi:hypothetical protein
LPPAAHSTGWAGVVAGSATLALAGLVPFGTGSVHGLVTKGDAVATAHTVSVSLTTLWLAIGALLVAVALDVVIARALRLVLLPINRRAAEIAAAFRIAYAAVFAVAVAQLTLATRGGTPDSILGSMNRFDGIWDAGLSLFGVHLLVVGSVLMRSHFAPRLLAVLVAVAGAGYVIDSVGVLLSANLPVRVAVFTFGGEPLLALWLLVRTWRRAT